MITIYTVTYNEEFQLQFFIDFYRKRFKDCHIVIYDNMSTDNTINIAKQNNCEVVLFDTNNKFSDLKNLEIKNNAWKNAKTDWVCVCDSDECIDITEDDLLDEEFKNSSILLTSGFNMINMVDNTDVYSINHGVRDPNFDKRLVFNKKFITNMNYSPGCHIANPQGNVYYSKRRYDVYHFNFINLEMSYEKYKTYALRLSDENKKYGWGFHYNMSKEEIEKEFLDLRKNANKLFNL